MLLLGIYLFGHPGRIDIVDGQFRYDVTKNLLNHRGPRVSDPELLKGALPTNLKTRVPYSYYSAPPSLIPIPLMIATRAVVGKRPASDRFSWSLASAFAAAGIGPLLVAFFARFGIPLKQAVGWTLIFALTTLWWPGAETVFDQCQHGTVLLAMVLTAYDVAKGGRVGWAFVTGLLGGLLVNYRIPFIVLLIVFPRYWSHECRRTASLDSEIKHQKNPSLARLNMMFVLGISVAWVAYLAYNWIRFDQFEMPSYDAGINTVGNPIAGFLTLAISPGKGVLWFSPTLLFAIFGWNRFFNADRGLGGMVLMLTFLHVAEMSCLWFVGGDYCWGPRYLLPIMPLWALAFPYFSTTFRRPFSTAYLRPVFSKALVGLGLGVQMMGISVDFGRFFYDHQLTLPPYFNVNPWGYFHYSQLLSRPAEILESIRERRRYRSEINNNPFDDATYAPFVPQYLVDKQGYPLYPPIPVGWPKPPLQIIAGTNRKSTNVRDSFYPFGPRAAPIITSVWEQKYRILYLPRPWWGWFDRVPSEQKPLDTRFFFSACCLITLLGAGFLRISFRGDKNVELDAKMLVLGK